MEKKVFGYPSFNEQGEKILTTYDNEYADMLMDIRVYRMKSGEKRTFRREGEEIAVLLLSGKIAFSWEGNTAEVSRKDVWTEGPYALHVSSGVQADVEAVEDSEILLDDFLQYYTEAGIKNVLCTDISRDGMLNGPSATLYAEVMAAFPHLHLIASGGVSSNEDILHLDRLGIPAVVFGKAYYEGKIDIDKLM